ncbi:MAG: hypothetical protein HC921_20525 [Synechococcaceae cyanobacterium SM2_3_1]|nr:hypothetical protein [Synechococcaceae cyanobacterium SM2_3_1]
MMDVADLLIDLAQKGVKLSLEGDNLKIHAPKGSITPEIRKILVEAKQDIISWLKENGSYHQSYQIVLSHSENRPENIPLSFGQERLWDHIQLDPATSLYNLPLSYVIEGYLDEIALEKVYR